MAGCWEQQDSVLVGVLHTENTTVAWALGLRNMQIPNGHVLCLAGMPYDMARNKACETLLNSHFQWLFFLDSDVVTPPDCIPRLLAHRLPIVSGVYCRRSPPAAIPVMLKGGQWVTQLPNLNKGENSLMEVDLVGAGCLLIHRSVLENTPPQRPGKRWFDWRVDMVGHLPPDQCLSEDFTWCRHVKAHGHKIIVDTSIRCLHVGYSQVSYGKLEPLSV